MTLWTDLRQAVRGLARQKRFTAVVAVTLGLAIGANAAVFHVVNLTLLRPLPFEDAERLYRIQASVTRPSGATTLVALSQQAFVRLRDAGTFEAVVAQRLENLSIRTAEGEPTRVVAVRVAAGWMDLLGVRPALGRGFTEEEERSGSGAPAVLLSDALWRRDFGADVGVLGRSIMLEERSLTVVGVMPPSFNYPYQAELWLPMTVDPGAAIPSNLNVVARLLAGETVEQAAAKLATLSAQLAREAPPGNAGRVLRATPLRTDLVEGSDRVLLALFAAVAFVLLIAAANVSSLLLTRASSRRREMAVRAALGATTGQRIRTVLSESLLLAALGGALGALIGAWSVGVVSVMLPREIRELGGQSAVDARMIAFVFAATALAFVIFAMAPAFRLSRHTSYSELGSGGRTTVTRGDRRLLGGVVVAEIAAALLLSVGAVQMLDAVRRVEAADPGFDPDGALTLRVPLSDRRLPTPETRLAFLSRVAEELRTMPGVETAGLTSLLPVGGGNQIAQVSIEGRAADAPQLTVNHRVVDSSYFAAMRIPLFAGRSFDDRDQAGSEPVAIVSRALADRFWPGADPLGQRIKRGRLSDPSPWFTVVGVVGSIREPREAAPETWYLPYMQQVGTFTGFVQPVFVVRAGVESGVLAEAARRAVARVDASTPVFQVATLRELNEQEFAEDRLGTRVVGSFAVAGILLVLLGVYGVTRYSVAQRAHEIAIRLAFGAPGRQIVRMIVGQAATLCALGLAVGTVATMFASRALGQLAPSVHARGWACYAVPTAAVFFVVATLAAGIPAWRASRLDPIDALQDR